MMESPEELFRNGPWEPSLHSDRGPPILQEPPPEDPPQDARLPQRTLPQQESPSFRQQDVSSVWRKGSAAGGLIHLRSETQGTVTTESSSEELAHPEDASSPRHSDEGPSAKSTPPRTATEPKLSVKYTRSETEASIRHVFETHASSTRAESDGFSLLLITGPCGSGKSFLAAKTLRQLVQERGGVLIQGSFDKSQLQAPSPYSALAIAFHDWARQMRALGEETVQAKQRAIHEALGEDESSILMLRSMIPGFSNFLEPEETSDAPSACPNKPICSATIKSRQSIQRITFVLSLFLQAICSPEEPLVLLLDDLQYADDCSLDIMVDVLTRTPGIFLVGTCDDSEISGRSYLACKMREIEDRGEESLVHVSIHDLDEQDVGELLHESLDCPKDEHLNALAQLVYGQTRGNVFYVTAFLHWLVKSELLDKHTSLDPWRWDMEEIRLSISEPCMDIVDFLSCKFLEELPTDMKDALKVAACLGSHFPAKLVAHAVGHEALSCLREATDRGILYSDPETGMYSFIHENLQIAAYRLIPESDRALCHLEIGRRIWRNISPCGLERLAFTILAQMQHGKHLISREKERLAVANLCLTAGTTAARRSTFRTAKVYLEFGLAMLNGRSWRDDYDLSLALFSFAAEVHMCHANFERMDQLVDTILANARRLQDKIPAYCTLIYALSAQGLGEKAIHTGIEVLGGLGEKFPARLCGVQFRKLYHRVLRLLKGKSNEVLLRMPIIVDSDKLASLQVLHLIFSTALLSKPKFTPFIVLTMMEITLRNGLSSFASLAFAYFGMIGLQYTDDSKTAYRYGELSLALLDRFQAEEFIPRVYCAFYGCIYPRRKRLEDTLEHLWNGHIVGMRTGDIHAAFLCASLWMMNAFESNIPLPVIGKRMKKCRDLMQLYRQTTQLAVVQPHIGTIDYLMGLTDDKDMDCGEVEVNPEAGTSEFHVPFTRMRRSFMFNDFGDTKVLQKKLLYQSHLVPPTFTLVSITFITGIAAVVDARQGHDVRRNKRFARNVVKKFKNVYALHSPDNCLSMQFLLEAELAGLHGEMDLARSKYSAAIALAETSQQLYVCGQAYERAANHLYLLGEKDDAYQYFLKSISAYQRWGAIRKVQALVLQLELDYKMSRPYLSPPSSDDQAE